MYNDRYETGNFRLERWEERDRVNLAIHYKHGPRGEEDIYSLWDEQALEAVEDGFVVTDKGAQKLFMSLMETAKERGWPFITDYPHTPMFKVYLETANSFIYVTSGLPSSRHEVNWIVCRQKKNGCGVHRVKSPKLPPGECRMDAQKALDEYAIKRKDWRHYATMIVSDSAIKALIQDGWF